MKKISFQSNGERVTGTLHFPNTKNKKFPAILFIHGWTSNENGYYPRAKALTKLGFICLTFNLRGHGTSSGKLEDFSRKDHLEDVISAYDFFTKQKFIDSNNISVVGASYGAYLGTLLARKRKIASLAMRAPALYLNSEFNIPTAKLIQDREDEFFQYMKPEKNNFALQGIKKVKKLLFIESEKDQIIPHRINEFYKHAASKNASITHSVVKGADHQLSKDIWKKKFIDIMVDWFKIFTPTP